MYYCVENFYIRSDSRQHEKPIVPYSQKIWREFNLVVGPKSPFLININLSVRYGIAVRICVRNFDLVVAK